MPKPRKEKVLRRAVLCFPIRINGNKEIEVLLGFKPVRKKGQRKIGEGFWNGYGGGIHLKETPIEAMARELEQECCLSVSFRALEKVAVIDFHNQKEDGAVFTCRVHVYTAANWNGEPTETLEMVSPTWFTRHKLPWRHMMPADKYWLPRVLNGKMIRGEFWYGPKQGKLIKPGKIWETNTLPRT